MAGDNGSWLPGLIGSLAWPAVVGASLFYFRKEALRLIESLRRQMNAGASLKYGGIEIKGIALDAIKTDDRGNWVYTRTSATAEDYNDRDAIYLRNRNLFLVHTTVRTDEFHPDNGFRLFETSIFLMPHQRYAKGAGVEEFGRLNEVNEVDYYLGRFWGSGEYGRRFRVKNGNDGFAVRFRAYGPSLCVATVKFHDGKQIKLERYIDFESAGGLREDDLAPRSNTGAGVTARTPPKSPEQ
jgi:hypothetical protein